MKRYQIYLNPYSVAVLDDFEKISNLTRSKVVRQAIDRLAEQLAVIVAGTKKINGKTSVLDTLAGFINLKTNKKTDFARQIDEIYFQDLK